jgi:hypothetical protein
MEAAVTFYLAEVGRRAEARAGLATLAGDDFRAINLQDSYPSSSPPAGRSPCVSGPRQQWRRFYERLLPFREVIYPRIQHRRRLCRDDPRPPRCRARPLRRGRRVPHPATKVHERIGAQLFLSRTHLYHAECCAPVQPPATTIGLRSFSSTRSRSHAGAEARRSSTRRPRSLTKHRPLQRAPTGAPLLSFAAGSVAPRQGPPHGAGRRRRSAYEVKRRLAQVREGQPGGRSALPLSAGGAVLAPSHMRRVGGGPTGSGRPFPSVGRWRPSPFPTATCLPLSLLPEL